MASISKKTANTLNQQEVSVRDLPLSCPMPEKALWDSHPRVYLPIEKTGEATCPYCSTHFVLLSENSGQ